MWDAELLRTQLCGVLLKNTAQYAELFDVTRVIMRDAELLRILKVSKWGENNSA